MLLKELLILAEDKKFYLQHKSGDNHSGPYNTEDEAEKALDKLLRSKNLDAEEKENINSLKIIKESFNETDEVFLTPSVQGVRYKSFEDGSTADHKRALKWHKDELAHFKAGTKDMAPGIAKSRIAFHQMRAGMHKAYLDGKPTHRQQWLKDHPDYVLGGTPKKLKEAVMPTSKFKNLFEHDRVKQLWNYAKDSQMDFKTWTSYVEEHCNEVCKDRDDYLGD